ncbi:MAG: superoxide dismutase [Nitrospiraceae bacterium]|nr:superoxide dismutase [Nitrospiraceae bacterium]
MKRTLSAVICLATIAGVCGNAGAHCQIPCGIYDDDVRFTLLSENIATIEKSMRLITELSAEAGENANQIVRWTINKENHADAFAEIITKYFLQQRIKPVAKDDKEAYAAYTEKVVLCHQMLVATMKAKQTTDQEHVDKLRALLAEFEEAYHGKDGGDSGSQ